MNGEKSTNKRVFDRINVTGSISVAGKHYPINDLSVGGMAVQGPILKNEPGDIMRVQFAIRHGKLYVSGTINCLYIASSSNFIARLKFVDPDEDLTEFFRAATLRSVSGSEYSVGWLAETSAQLPLSKVKPRRSFLSRFVSLPMLLAVTIVFLFGVFLLRTTTAEAVWAMYYYEVVSPVGGQIKSLKSPPFAAGELVSEVSVIAANGEPLTIPIKTNIASVTVDWLVSLGDYVEVGDTLGHLYNIPQNYGSVRAIVTMNGLFTSPRTGDSIVLETELGELLVGKVTQSLNSRQIIEHNLVNSDINLNKKYFFVEFDTDVAKIIGRLELKVFDTLLKNLVRKEW